MGNSAQRKSLKNIPGGEDAFDPEMVALDYFRRLGDDNHRRLSKLSAWEEKKSKASSRAQIVDYEKIAAAAVERMKTADLNRFLIVSALVSDLYCPGYNPRQSLEKNSNLASTAGRYRVDVAKIAAAVQEELSKSKDQMKGQRKPSRSQPRRGPNSAISAIDPPR